MGMQVASLERDAPGHVASFHMAYLQHDPCPQTALPTASPTGHATSPSASPLVPAATPYNQQPSTHSSVLHPSHLSTEPAADTAMREAGTCGSNGTPVGHEDVSGPLRPRTTASMAASAADCSGQESISVQEDVPESEDLGDQQAGFASHGPGRPQSHQQGAAEGLQLKQSPAGTACSLGEDSRAIASAAVAAIPKVTFLYRLAPGVADRSFGLNVARMAHLPQQVIACAAVRASDMESSTLKRAQAR